MMDEQTIEALAALAHRTRLSVFRLLVRAGPDGMAAGDIARALAVPVTTMSGHLAALHRAGLAFARREGRVVRYGLDVEGTRAVFTHLLADCCDGRPDLCAPLAGLAACAPVREGGCHEPL